MERATWKQKKLETEDTFEESVQQTDCREVDGHGEDDKGHDPEHGFHGSQVGVVDTRLGTQLKKEVTSNYQNLSLLHHFFTCSYPFLYRNGT